MRMRAEGWRGESEPAAPAAARELGRSMRCLERGGRRPRGRQRYQIQPLV